MHRRLPAWLGLAAAPTFAAMALLTALSEDMAPAAMCGSGGPPFALGGMAPMYMLMAVFHLPPWLRLTAKDGFDQAQRDG